ncbi:MAG: DUF3990 domain-containing protein [Proteobacteria bacterium]|nr:DUF3990 domain-containing protein [Pseudomonadota bacterium]
MILYHGSNVVVEAPEPGHGLRAMDFGPAFYTTSSLDQALRWARAVARRRRHGQPIVNIYQFDEQAVASLSVQLFKSPDEAWLDFVVENRTFPQHIIPFDLVIGPIANDSTIQVIDDYMLGRYTKTEAINHLLPQNLKDQYAFLSADALSHLHFREYEIDEYA